MARETETAPPAANPYAASAVAPAEAPLSAALASAAAETHWAAGAVNKWISLELLNSRSVEEFRPDDLVTRAEFVTMINNLFGFVRKGGPAFSDVPPDAWYYDAVSKAAAASVVMGDGSGNFHPDSNITRQETAVILTRIFSLPAEPGDALGAFKDASDVAGWSASALNSLTAKGYLTGRPGNLLAPKGNCSRAESLKMIDNIAGRIIGKPGTYTGDCESSMTVNKSEVVLRDMTIGGDLFVTQGVGDGTVTLDHVTVKGRTVVKGGGEHSIVIINSYLAGTLLVVKQDGKVRIVAQGDTAIPRTSMGTGGRLENGASSGGGFGSVEILGTVEAGQVILLDGAFNAVCVAASGVSVAVQSGTVGTLEVGNGVTQSQVTVHAGAVVSELTANAPVSVTGQGTIRTANINSGDVVIEKNPENVVVATGVSATVGGRTVTGRNTQTDIPSGTGGTSGDPSSPVTVTGVAAIAAIQVGCGTAKGSIGLPSAVTVTLSSGGSATAGVAWDNGTPAYHAQTAGTYMFSGTLAPTGNVTNPSGLKASATVTVLAQTRYKVSFIVSDGTAPLMGAIVAVPGNAAVSTGADGRAEVSLADGSYSYSVSAVGYNEETGTVTVSGADMVKTVMLSVSPVTLYTVTFDSNGGSPVDSQRLALGALISQMLTPYKTGYVFTGWYRDSALTTLWDFAKDTVPAGDITLYAGWTVATYTLSYVAEDNGTITGAATQTVRHGSGGTTVKAMANAGYEFSRWSDDPSLVYASRTDLNVTRNIAATAIFTPRQYTLSYAAGPNGSVTGSLNQTVAYGASGTPVTAAAVSGYHFVRWSDGSTANPRTDSGITGAVSATAVFEQDQLVFSVSDSDGDISGATVLIWPQGTDPGEIAAKGQTAVSDSNGRAALTLPAGSYDYSVFMADYTPAVGSVIVENSGTMHTVSVTLTPCTPLYTASISTYFKEVYNIVEGGGVELIGIGVSDANANSHISRHTFSVGSGVYYYKAYYSSEQMGTYLTGSGSVTVEEQDVSANAYMDYLPFDVTLTVTDGIDPIAGAKVYINDLNKSSAPLTTDANGTVVYSDCYQGSGLRYIVSRDGYDDFTGYLSPNLNHTAYTVAAPYSVTFSLSAGGSPAAGVRVTLGNKSGVTDTEGRLAFRVPGGQSYSYTLSGFYCAPASGSVTVRAQDVSVSLALTALPTHALTLAVTDADSRAPIRGAEIVLRKQADLSQAVSAMTDTGGQAVFQAPDGQYSYTVTKEQYDTEYGSVTMTGADKSHGAALTTVNRTVTLIVKDSSGGLLQGAYVLVESEARTTGADGSAVFTLTDGSYGFQVSASGHADLTGSFQVRGASETLTLFLQPSAVYAVTIRAVDTGGKPVWNVSMAPDGGESVSFGGQTVLYLKSGSYRYHLTAPGYEPTDIDFTVGAAATSVTATMTPAQKYELTFAVYDENNRALSGATVTLSNGDWGYTDLNGRVTLSEYPGTYSYTVKAFLKADRTGTVTLGSADQVEIVSQSVLVSKVTYKVMDASGAPLSGARVTVNGEAKITETDGAAQFELAYGDYSFTVTAEGYTGRSGITQVRGADIAPDIYMARTTTAFQVVVTDGVHSIPGAVVKIGEFTAPLTDRAGSTFLDLPDETYAYSVSRAGYANATGTVTVSGEVRVLNVLLTEESRVEISVVDHNYARPNAEQISVTINDVTETIISANIPENYPLSAHFTLVAGTYSVTILAAGYEEYSGSITVTATARGFDIPLTPRAYTATLTVRDGAGPASGAAVTLASYSGQETAVTGEDGTATFHNVSYNRQYYYTVSKAGYQGISSFNSANSFVVAGDTAREVTLTGLPVRVQVRSASTHEPVQGAAVTAGGVTQTTDANGAAVFTPSGGTVLTYTVSALSYRTAEGSLDLSEGGDGVVVTLTLLTQRVTFTVTEGTNPYKTHAAQPIYGAQIITANTAALTGNDGTAALELPLGSNTCYILKEGYLTRSIQVDVTQDGVQTVSLEPQDYVNSVTVTGLDNAALAGATVSCNGISLGTTNAAGRLSFRMPAGGYMLTFSAEGYDTGTQYVPFSPVNGQGLSMRLDRLFHTVVVNVADSSGPLPGAAVTVGRAAVGSADADTDAAGQAVFVVYHGENSCSVTMPGYERLDSTAAVTEGATLNLTLTKARYKVTLCVWSKVGGGVHPVRGATVLVGAQSVTTGDDGQAEFRLLRGTYTYSVTKDNFTAIDADFTVDCADAQVNAMLSAVNIETFHVYDMTSYILNGQPSPVEDTGLPPLAGAAVTVYTTDENRPVATGVTDGSGVAVLDLGSFSDTYRLKYRITKAHYTDLLWNAAAVGSFDITATTVTSVRMYNPLRNLSFSVTDAGSGQAPGGVNISVGSYYASALSGYASLEVPAGAYSYTVWGDGYETAVGSVTVDGDTRVSVRLTPRATTVSFRVTDGTKPLEGAAVYMGSAVSDTDAGGNAVCTLPGGGTYTYQIYLEGYHPARSTITVPAGGAPEIDAALTPITANVAVVVADSITQSPGNKIGAISGPAVGAVVTINGQSAAADQYGIAYLTLEAGSYDMKIAYPGYAEYHQAVTLSANTKTIAVRTDRMTPVPSAVEISLALMGAPVSGVEVTMTPAVISPLAPEPVTAVTNASGIAWFDLNNGSYTLSVQDDRYFDVSDTIAVTGQDISNTQALTSRPAPPAIQSATLVHKTLNENYLLLTFDQKMTVPGKLMPFDNPYLPQIYIAIGGTSYSVRNVYLGADQDTVVFNLSEPLSDLWSDAYLTVPARFFESQSGGMLPALNGMTVINGMNAAQAVRQMFNWEREPEIVDMLVSHFYLSGAQVLAALRLGGYNADAALRLCLDKTERWETAPWNLPTAGYSTAETVKALKQVFPDSYSSSVVEVQCTLIAASLFRVGYTAAETAAALKESFLRPASAADYNLPAETAAEYLRGAGYPLAETARAICDVFELADAPTVASRLRLAGLSNADIITALTGAFGCTEAEAMDDLQMGEAVTKAYIMAAFGHDAAAAAAAMRASGRYTAAEVAGLLPAVYGTGVDTAAKVLSQAGYSDDTVFKLLTETLGYSCDDAAASLCRSGLVTAAATAKILYGKFSYSTVPVILNNAGYTLADIYAQACLYDAAGTPARSILGLGHGVDEMFAAILAQTGSRRGTLAAQTLYAAGCPDVGQIAAAMLKSGCGVPDIAGFLFGCSGFPLSQIIDILCRDAEASLSDIGVKTMYERELAEEHGDQAAALSYLVRRLSAYYEKRDVVLYLYTRMGPLTEEQLFEARVLYVGDDASDDILVNVLQVTAAHFVQLYAANRWRADKVAPRLAQYYGYNNAEIIGTLYSAGSGYTLTDMFSLLKDYEPCASIPMDDLPGVLRQAGLNEREICTLLFDLYDTPAAVGCLRSSGFSVGLLMRVYLDRFYGNESGVITTGKSTLTVDGSKCCRAASDFKRFGFTLTEIMGGINSMGFSIGAAEAYDILTAYGLFDWDEVRASVSAFYGNSEVGTPLYNIIWNKDHNELSLSGAIYDLLYVYKAVPVDPAEGPAELARMLKRANYTEEQVEFALKTSSPYAWSDTPAGTVGMLYNVMMEVYGRSKQDAMGRAASIYYLSSVSGSDYGSLDPSAAAGILEYAAMDAQKLGFSIAEIALFMKNSFLQVGRPLTVADILHLRLGYSVSETLSVMVSVYGWVDPIPYSLMFDSLDLDAAYDILRQYYDITDMVQIAKYLKKYSGNYALPLLAYLFHKIHMEDMQYAYVAINAFGVTDPLVILQQLNEVTERRYPVYKAYAMIHYYFPSIDTGSFMLMAKASHVYRLTYRYQPYDMFHGDDLSLSLSEGMIPLDDSLLSVLIQIDFPVQGLVNTAISHGLHYDLQQTDAAVKKAGYDRGLGLYWLVKFYWLADRYNPDIPKTFIEVGYTFQEIASALWANISHWEENYAEFGMILYRCGYTDVAFIAQALLNVQCPRGMVISTLLYIRYWSGMQVAQGAMDVGLTLTEIASAIYEDRTSGVVGGNRGVYDILTALAPAAQSKIYQLTNFTVPVDTLVWTILREAGVGINSVTQMMYERRISYTNAYIALVGAGYSWDSSISAVWNHEGYHNIIGITIIFSMLSSSLKVLQMPMDIITAYKIVKDVQTAIKYINYIKAL